APRRMAYYDYTHPALHPHGLLVLISVVGGMVLVVSAGLFLYILASARTQSGPVRPFSFAVAVHPELRPPAPLNSLRLWVGMMIALTLVNYAYPIAQLASLPEAWVPVIPIGGQ
ncbi:UNVERIFIED_CONTAM: hypothetical protein QE602_11405, partial [Streptococcus suis]